MATIVLWEYDMNSWDSQAPDTDDIIIIKLCMHLKFLSLQQLENIYSKNVGRQFIFALMDSKLLAPDQMNELFSLRGKAALCDKCDELNFRKSQQKVLLCRKCGVAIRQKSLKKGGTTTSPRNKYGKFKIKQKIGEGNVGVVYKAIDTELDRLVALKMLKMAEGEQVARFKQEARSVAALNHEYIVSIYDIGEDLGEHFIAMEYVPGEKLSQYMELNEVSYDDSLAIVIKIAEGLQHAHEHQIIHRDIKPDNIIITNNQIPKVTDFGLARKLSQNVRITRDNIIMGTPIYMSPEQANDDPHLGHETDIYSLGVVLYEMLAGRTPFLEAPTLTLLQQIVYQPPPPLDEICPDLDSELIEICLKALAKKKQERFSSMEKFAQALKDYLDKKSSSPHLSSLEKSTVVPSLEKSAVVPSLEKSAVSPSLEKSTAAPSLEKLTMASVSTEEKKESVLLEKKPAVPRKREQITQNEPSNSPDQAYTHIQKTQAEPQNFVESSVPVKMSVAKNESAIKNEISKEVSAKSGKTSRILNVPPKVEASGDAGTLSYGQMLAKQHQEKNDFMQLWVDIVLWGLLFLGLVYLVFQL